MMRLLLWLLLPMAISAFNMPTLEDIGDIFHNLVKRGAGLPVEKAAPQPKNQQETHSRTKRQDPGIGDESQNAWEARSSKMPMMPGSNTLINDRYMPVLANGHIAVTVYNDSLHVNGLFNGVGGESHRAKVPAAIMSRVKLQTAEQERLANRKFTFNVKEGVWIERIEYFDSVIIHKIYAHMKYIRLLVSDVYVKEPPVKRAKEGGLGLLTLLGYPDLNATDDIRWDSRRSYQADWKVSGTTKSAEQGATTQKVSIFWQEPLRQISVRTQEEVHEIMVMAIDKSEAAAQNDFDRAKNVIQNKGPNGLYDEHVAAWAEVWDEGKVEVVGESAVQKAVEFSQYYLLTSMSPIVPDVPPQHNEILIGVGRGSLGRGSLGKDYQGHVFWDSEMYIMPAVLLFQPELAKKMIRYRSTFREAAAANAKLHGDEGYRFPWESGCGGQEVIPENTCDGCRDRQIHVSAAVAWAIRQYYSATRDRDFITNPDYNACDMTREIARLFVNRAQYNTEIGRYDIKDVMGPDDFHDHVDNNAYTNVMASLAIHWARYMACVCNRNERDEVPDEWIQKALYLELPFDNVKRMHHQYENFDTNTNKTNKQADTILLTYPLNWNMSTDIMKNDLEYYMTITSDKSPAMTWSFFTVGFKWVNDLPRTDSYFRKSYQNYIISPFKVWTEYNEQSAADQVTGSVNFLPGMGAFLQSLIYGFAGVRIRPEALEFHNPQPPTSCNEIHLKRLKYLGTAMTVKIQRERVYLTVHEVGDYPLVLRRNDSSNSVEESLTQGAEITIEPASSGFYIYALSLLACEHPRDYIYMPWGYSPWISHGMSLQPPTVYLSLLAVVTMLLVCRPML